MFSKLIQFLNNIGSKEDDSFETSFRKKFLIYMGIFMSGGGILWGNISIYLEFFYSSLIPFGYVIITFFNLFYFYKTKNFKVVRFIQVLLSLLLPFFFQWSLGGVMNSGGVMLWSMLSVVGAMTFNDTKSNIKWLVLYTVLVIISGCIDEMVTEFHKEYYKEVPKLVGVSLGAMNLVIISNIVFGLTIFLLYTKEMANKKSKETIKNIKYKTEELNEKNFQLESLSNKLSKYLAPQVYNSIFTGNQNVNTESKRKKLTIFFSDIVGFTSITDNIEPENLSLYLNEYLNKMSEIALKHGGTIDKFIGDAIMIFFGDPKTEGEKQDALNCVCMALEMKSYIEYKWKQFEKGEINNAFKIRIGINSGFSIVGNFGSENRMDYSIIGKEVNLAGKLEQKAEPMNILISESTYELVKDEIECTKKDPLLKKDKSKLLDTYQIVKRKIPKEEKINFEKKGEGFSISLDLSKVDKNLAIDKLEESLARLRG